MYEKDPVALSDSTLNALKRLRYAPATSAQGEAVCPLCQGSPPVELVQVEEVVWKPRCSRCKAWLSLTA